MKGNDGQHPCRWGRDRISAEYYRTSRRYDVFETRRFGIAPTVSQI